jgi:short-subunit dehydrogenase
VKTLTQRFLFPHVSLNGDKLARAVRGKTIVITGASYGIGQALAVLLSHHGVHLVLIARTEGKLHEVAAAVRQNGSQCTVIAANLYLETEVQRVIDALVALPGGIDIFVSNAGKSIMRPLEQSLDRFHDVTRTNALNYLAPAQLLLALTPMLKASGGQIINVSALNVLLLPAPGWAAYQAGKTAFDQWLRCHQPEWKLMGIAAKTLYLPLVRTRMIAPNPLYTNYPAMQPRQAAVRIARLICANKSYSRPWWAVFAQTGSFLGRGLWERLTVAHLKKKRHAA